MDSEQSIVIHLVHGTFDARKPGISHWCDSNGALAQGVKALLPIELQNRVRFEPFDWSGTNSFVVRSDAAKALAEVLDQPSSDLRLLIGHSHGGTVIADALVAAKQPNALAAMTLATPFVARLLDLSQGRLSMALYAPLLAFWIALSGVFACAIHSAWVGAGLCLLGAAIAPFGFARNPLGRWASIWGLLVIFIAPLAFIVAAIWDWKPSSTLPASLLLVAFIVGLTAQHWQDWIWARLSALRGIPEETDLPNAPAVPLTALRLPGDEASFAIVVAQAMLWFETKNVLGTVIRWVQQAEGISGNRAAFTGLLLWASSSGVVALTSPGLVWWLVPIGGLWFLLIALVVIALALAVALLWLRVLTITLLALATGIEVIDGMGAVTVYAEPLPRWNSHAHCRLEILGWTEDDGKKMPPLRHSMHRLEFVHRRVAVWIVDQLKTLP